MLQLIKLASEDDFCSHRRVSIPNKHEERVSNSEVCTLGGMEGYWAGKSQPLSIYQILKSWTLKKKLCNITQIYVPIFMGSKISADGDCSHEIKRHLLLGRKVMTNLDSILKGRDITLPTKVRLIKAMVFSVVMYECENWTIKKAECQRIDAFSGVGEDSWESLGLQGDPTSAS